MKEGSSMASSALEEENKALRTKVSVLERELKLRNAECAKLRQDLQELSQVKQTNESQRDVITGLRNQLELTSVAHASAMEMIEKMKKEIRDKEHRERVESLNARLNEHKPSPSGTSNVASLSNASAPTRGTSGGVVLTSSGPQIICNSSGISSLGFAQVQRPVDFLGGVQKGTQQQQQQPAVDGEEDEVARIMEMAKEEAMMEIQYAEVEDHEEKELRERFEALRNR
ncbi:uncharacterized protein TM35_000083650 [Trypanosoma theileri]|uniref:Uncharacterized protein n=1 Tax=Trypanosoma theileri TaxID=67003 RepID=A0A1X0P0W7_9TRYP|nr:uncharacterized protein TM35_000083650 [Trypanosoma theileri]ORC90567.1 hypothetical protein TM35_000083650 [Trypanosoma theileri]